jgi:hypothetical protein
MAETKWSIYGAVWETLGHLPTFRDKLSFLGYFTVLILDTLWYAHPDLLLLLH